MKKNISFDKNPLDKSTKLKKWYEEYPKTEEPCKHSKSEMDVMNLKDEAKKCLNSESTAYHMKESKARNSDYSWWKSAFFKGTIKDKVAAGIILVQSNPKYNLNYLLSLVSQVKVAKHNKCGEVITNLKELFLTELLHPNFKLIKFEEQNLDQLDSYNKSFDVANLDNLNNKPVLSKNKLLTLWYFEDQLKEIYEKFITALSAIANDTVDTNREKAVGVMNDLLMGNPEQEQKLLDFLINKIGDPSSKIASKTVFCLTKLLYKHPNMKLIVLKEVEKFLFRANISSKAQYFAICLLTQFVLSIEDTEVATTLIEVYFAFFKACLKKGEPDSRMMAAILIGVNRAYRFSDTSSIKLNSHIESVYRVVHVGSFNVSLNALSLLFQVVSKNPDQSNRFYSAFYRKLLDPQIGVANKRAVFLNLLFRVMKNDPSILRLHAYIKRVLQISAFFPANMTCAILYTISQVLRFKKISNKILVRCVGSEDKKNDYHNSAKELDEDEELKEKTSRKRKVENSIILSNVIIDTIREENNLKNDQVQTENIAEVKPEYKATCYNAFARNPLFAGANLSIYTELVALANHFHPSVALFASTILEGKPIEYTGDPLQDLALIRFLDRYVFKNPKKLESKKVVKKNDPLAHRVAYTPKGIRTLPVDSMAYLNEREDKIPVDELFLYRYLRKRKEQKSIRSHDDDDDIESVNSEDFNDMLDQLSKTKHIDKLDVASDFSSKPKKSKGKEDDMDEMSDEGEDSDIENVEVDDDEDQEELETDDDDGIDFQDLDDLDLEDIDDDASDMEFNDNDSDDLKERPLKKRKLNKSDRKHKPQVKGLPKNTFVSSEEFAEMLENQGRSKFKYGASKSLSDRDGASVKQLDWETNRNQRISGYRKDKKEKKLFNNFKSKKHFSKAQKLAKRKQ
ncbi:CCAAT/enhancer-binding protein zeta [Phymastichus coffea]|uniref:CCAAT/enhancer-binding protein zeta n=1 Tax=Phymastichus coffea TaxID=108790 RepID=UPI00273AF839|nr:CCAAT/enhancer-binding protein zeta [Phymastichus coffea]